LHIPFALRCLPLVAGVIAASLGTPSAFAQAPPAKPLVWAADAEGGQPYVYQDGNEIIGFEKDIADALARELGRPIEFKQYDFKNIISGVERRDFDFAMNGYEITPDRQKRLRFSKPYYTYRLQLVARADDQRFQSFDELTKLPGIEVGTLADTAALRLLQAKGIPAKVYDDQQAPYIDLALGRTDAVLLDLPIALWVAKGNDKFRFVGAPIQPGSYAIAFAKDNEALADQVDAALDRLRASGKLKRILKAWDLWDDAQETTPEDGPSAPSWTIDGVLLQLLYGAGWTIVVSVSSMLLAICLGLPIALLRLYGPAPLRFLAALYVEFFRGIPILLLLWFIYYGLPLMLQSWQLGSSAALNPLAVAILGFGLNYAAYESEIYRAGLGAVSVSQWEAAASLGMSPALTFRRIILPQAVRTILPPMTNDFVGLFKDTSVVSVIGVIELTKTYLMLAAGTQRYFEIGLLTALLYLLMSVPLGYLSRSLEKRWGAAA
jgi:polar amino acid transport system substrate-binding protein